MDRSVTPRLGSAPREDPTLSQPAYLGLYSVYLPQLSVPAPSFSALRASDARLVSILVSPPISIHPAALLLLYSTAYSVPHATATLPRYPAVPLINKQPPFPQRSHCCDTISRDLPALQALETLWGKKDPADFVARSHWPSV